MKYLVYNSVKGKSTARPIVSQFECDPSELADQTALLGANEVAVAAPDDFDLYELTEDFAQPLGGLYADDEVLPFTVSGGLVAVTTTYTIAVSFPGYSIYLMDSDFKGFLFSYLHTAINTPYIVSNTADTVTLSAAFSPIYYGATTFTLAYPGFPVIWNTAGVFTLIPAWNTVTGLVSTFKILTVTPNLDNLNAGGWMTWAEGQRANLEAAVELGSFMSESEIGAFQYQYSTILAAIASPPTPLVRYPSLVRYGDFTGTDPETVFQRMVLRDDVCDPVAWDGANSRPAAGSGIVESGGSGGGRWIKFADGTMICTLSIADTAGVNTASGALFISAADKTWTFPQTFVGNPVVTANATRSDRACGIYFTSTPSTTAVDYRYWVATTMAGGGTINGRLAAIGRWRT